MPRLLVLTIFLPVVLLSCATAGLEHKKQSEARRNLGEAYLHQGNPTAALRELLAAEKLYADDPYLQNGLGLAYLAKNKPDEAVRHLENAIRLKPDFAPAINNLGTAYLATNQLDQAIEAFSSIRGDLLYATPHYPLANLGIAYYRKHDYVRSETYFRDSLRVSPNFPIALKGLADTLTAQGKIDQAIVYLEEAARSAPRSPEIFWELGSAYLQIRKPEPALRAFEKVVELSPSTELGRMAQARIQEIRRP